jgi:hypothetical protein
VPSSSHEGRATPVVRPALIAELIAGIDGTVLSRVPIREWWMSSVSRVFLVDGRSVVLKCAVDVFADEPAILAYAASHGVPVPKLLASTIYDDGRMAMLIEDLGELEREADITDAAAAAVAVHRCPRRVESPVLDYDGLVELPARSLAWLGRLQKDGRWLQADDLRVSLGRLADVAKDRAKGAEIPPFGMCHSEFHPTSIHIGRDGMRILDWARSFTGPGLFDLVSWQGTRGSLDFDALADLIAAYVVAGGAAEAVLKRGGLAPHVWAVGWFKVWICEWFIQQAARWQDAADDAVTEGAVRRHLWEAIGCLG